MVFLDEKHSAERMQHSINEIMNALAEALSRVRIGCPDLHSESRVSVDVETIPVREPGIEIETVQPLPQLTGREALPQIPSSDSLLLEGDELPLLQGSDPRLLDRGIPFLSAAVPFALEAANFAAELQLPETPDFPLLPGAAEYDAPTLVGQAEPAIAVQIGETQIAGTLSQLQEQIATLAPEQVAHLQQALQQPTGTVLAGEAVTVAVNGIVVLHQDEQGVQHNQITDALQSDSVPMNSVLPPFESSEPEAVATTETAWRTVDVEKVFRETESPPVPGLHTELRPVGEVESLTGQEANDISALNGQVVSDAPSLVITVDDLGHVKSGSYIRDSVEATEDEVAETETIAAEQRLTPEALFVVVAVQDYFAETGDTELSTPDYQFQQNGDRLLLVPNDAPDETLAIEGDRIEPAIHPARFEALMQRFSIIYERTCSSAAAVDAEQEYER